MVRLPISDALDISECFFNTMNSKGPAFVRGILLDDAFFFHKGEQRAWNMAFMFNMAGVDTQGSTNLGIGQPFGRSIFQEGVNR